MDISVSRLCITFHSPTSIDLSSIPRTIKTILKSEINVPIAVGFKRFHKDNVVGGELVLATKGKEFYQWNQQSQITTKYQHQKLRQISPA